MADKQIVTQLNEKTQDGFVIYEIGGKAENIFYDNSISVRTKINSFDTPEKNGFGYAVSSDSAETVDRTATLSDYKLIDNSFVAVKFTTSVVDNATLNINNQGAKPIYFKSAAIKSGDIEAGSLVTLIYDGVKYQLLVSDKKIANVEVSYGVLTIS